MPPPLISVLLPCYNHEKFVDQAIKSVLAQIYEHWQLILVDDCSQDGSVDIMRAYAKSDNRIILLENEKNVGVNESLVAGLEHAAGDFYCGCAADDYISDRGFFWKAMDMTHGGAASGVYGIAERIRATDGSLIDRIGCGVKDGYISPDRFKESFLSRTSFVTGYSSIWRMEMIEKVGGFPMNLGPQTDYFINHVLPAKWGVYFLPEVTTMVRIFENGRNYSGGATVPEKIERHATFENMWRSEVGEIDQNLLLSWRNQLIYDLCGGEKVDYWKTIYHQYLK